VAEHRIPARAHVKTGGIMGKPTLLVAAIAAAFYDARAPGRVPGGHGTSTAPDQSACPVYPRAPKRTCGVHRAAARRSGPPAPERGDLVVTGKPDLEWRDPAPEDSTDIQSIATLPDGERIGEVHQLVSPDEADDVSAVRLRPPN
jgi:hypothetical protein